MGALNDQPVCCIEIEDTTYVIEDLITGFQTLFKVFKGLNLDYPDECGHIWKLLENVIYNIDTSTINNNQVTTLINEFKLASETAEV